MRAGWMSLRRHGFPRVKQMTRMRSITQHASVALRMQKQNLNWVSIRDRWNGWPARRERKTEVPLRPGGLSKPLLLRNLGGNGNDAEMLNRAFVAKVSYEWKAVAAAESGAVVLP